MVFEITEGWTEPLDFQLIDNGAPFPIPGGATLSLSIVRADGLVMPVAGTVTVLDAGDGRVRYQPDAADLKDGRYNVRFRVRVAGVDGFFPSGARDLWRVHL